MEMGEYAVRPVFDPSYRARGRSRGQHGECVTSGEVALGVYWRRHSLFNTAGSSLPAYLPAYLSTSLLLPNVLSVPGHTIQ